MDATDGMHRTYYARGYACGEASIALHGFALARYALRSLARQKAENPHYLAGYVDALIAQAQV